MQSGDLAPPIQLSAIDGNVFDSRSLAGRRYLVTLFRFASCPFCNRRMAELVRRRDELGEDFEIIAIFEADVGHLQKHASQHLAVFPVWRYQGYCHANQRSHNGYVARLPAT